MSLFVGVDWGKDNSFTGLDDVTARARGGRAGTISAQYGRDQVTATSPVTAGRGSLVLGNEDRALSPRNTSSPLYGSLKPARPVLVTRTIGATTYTLFRGHTDFAPINPDVEARNVTVALVDSLQDFRRKKISTGLYNGLRTGDAIGLVLDAAGWTGGRDLDPGATLIPWWWLSDTDALTALQDLVASEGPPALLTIGSSGEIVFRDRHHRILDARSLTSQSTWRGSTVEPVMQGYVYDDAWGNIVNSTSLTVDVRQAADLQVVWSSTSTIDISDGETKLITAVTQDPFYAAVVPDSTDMVLTGAVSVDLTRTDGGSTTIRITASGGPAQITSLQLRAFPIVVARQVQVAASDVASVAEYDARGYAPSGGGTALPWAGPYDAQAILDTVVAQRAQPLAIVTARFQIGGTNTTKAAALLALDLSDRVTVVDPDSGTPIDYFIESIAHEVAGEEDHSITFGLEAAPTIPTSLLRFDAAGRGFNDGTFSAGLDDPSTILAFDAGSGHRFDEGVFAA